MRAHAPAALIVALTLIGVGGVGCAAGAPLDTDTALADVLAGTPDDALVAVVVTFATTPLRLATAPTDLPARRQAINLELRAHSLQRVEELRAALPELRAVEILPLWSSGGAALTVTKQTIRALQRHRAIASVRLDRTWYAPPPAAPLHMTTALGEWNLDAIQLQPLWAAGHHGQGVTVASLDTGVDGQHPDLTARWRGGDHSWFDPFAEHATPTDVDGHGTQVLGIAVGGRTSGATLGVAPGARWMAAKIYADDGHTSLSAIHRSLQWLLDPDDDPATDDAPAVVNNSWGFEEQVDSCVGEFEVDLLALRAAGIGVVFAAGNAGPAPASSVSPANGGGVLAVGAIDARLEVVASSSRGPSPCTGEPFPSLVAPGDQVRTADLTLGGAVPAAYARVQGTSFAAPHVTGAAAVLRGACPAASWAQVEQAMQASATDVGPAGIDAGAGHGLLDVDGAWRQLRALGVCLAITGREATGDAQGRVPGSF